MKRPDETPSLLWRILAPVAALALATVVTLTFWDAVFHRVPFALYFAAVVVAAWRTGWLVGIVVGVAGVAIVATTHHFDPGILAPSVVLIAVSVFISLLAASRERAVRALLDSERQYRLMVENVRDYALFMTDTAGDVTKWNVGAERLLGWTAAEIVGTTAAVVFTPEDRARGADLREMETAARAGHAADERWHLRKDGSRLFASGMLMRVDDDAGRHVGFTKVVRDITERKRAADRMERMYAVAAALSEAVTPQDVARVTVDQGIAAVGGTAGSLALLAEGGTRLDLVGSVGYPPEVIERWRQFPLDAPIPLAEAVRTGESIFIDSPEERLTRYPALAPVNAIKETKASACIPLSIGGRSVGVLGLSFDRPGGFSPDDREFVMSLCRQCAQSLDRARLFVAERRARADAEAAAARAEASAAEAERASEAKSEFLATLSHELRTPLTPVLLTVSLIEAHPGLPQDLREDVAAIRRNVELESRLISDLLDLTRIAKGKLQLDFREVDFHLAIRSAVDVCQREASARVTLELRATRHHVWADLTRVQQVVWNLVNNAVRHGGPNVLVRTSDAPGERVRLEVADDGAGIDPALLPKLFTAFEQGDARAKRQFAGLGLGLAICKRLVEAHGGTIAVRSEGRGRGATFAVELPVIDAAPPAPLAAAPAGGGTITTTPTRPAVGRPLRVLLVEDHDTTRAVLSKLLRRAGHAVTEAASLAAALAAVRQGEFDLILSDVGLPDGSGLDLMRQVRDRYAGRAIALTGYGMEADVAASRAAGFTEHLTKPVDLAALQASIARVVGQG